MTFLTHNVSKYLFAAVILIFGLMHFAFGSNMAGIVPVPGGVFWVYLTGLFLAASAIAIFINKYASLATLLLAILLLSFALSIHLPALLGGDQMAMTSLLKDLAMAAGAGILSGVFRRQEEGIA